MDSRMDKYSESKQKSYSRAEKNKKLYDSLTDIDMDYIDINVDNVLEIASTDLNKKSRSDYHKVKELESIVPTPVETIILDEPLAKKEKIYDIDEILERAKSERQAENKKRLINTEYNILTKLDIKDIDDKNLNEDEIKELVKKTYPEEEVDDQRDLFYDMVEEKELLKEQQELSNTQKQINEPKNDNEITATEEFIKNTPSDTLNHEEINILKDLPKKEVLDAIDSKEVISEEQLTTQINPIDKESDMYTTSTTQILSEQKKSKKTLIFVIIVVLILLAMGVYLFLKYFGTL